MRRLFVAIRPPASIRALLLDAMGGIGGARWQSDDQLHLTLRFVGEVDRHLAGDIHAALGGVHHPRFEIALNGLGTFDRRGQPGALWAGVTPHAPLKSLHQKVSQALSRVGIPPEQRAYLPHVTLARLKVSGRPIHLLETAGGLTSPPFAVEKFALFESRLTPEGAVYSIVESYRLVAQAPADESKRSTSPA